LDTDLRETVLKEIARNLGEKICFILEGYNELPEIFYSSSVFTQLRGKLPKCTLIYTSHPEACNKIEVPSRFIKIAGFKKESVDEYISKALDHVKDGHNLSSQLNLKYTQIR